MKARYGKRGDSAQQKRERAVIRKIAEDTARGITAGIVASWLNAKPMPTPGPDGGTWSRKAVERVIEGNPRAMARGRARLEKERSKLRPAALGSQAARQDNAASALTPIQKLSLDLANEDRVSDEPLKTWDDIEADRKRHALAQQAATIARYDLAKDWKFYDPRDFRTWDEVTSTHMDGHDRINKPALSSEENWAKSVDEIVKVLVTTRGETIHELLDRIEGQPGVKGPLRRMLWGLMREIALQRQANLALRQRLGQKVEEQPETPAPTMDEAEAQIERWRIEQRVPAARDKLDKALGRNRDDS